ncbi:MAG: hypothetical protein AABY22_25120 [Nanoarchaeota archaeon]
MNEEYKFVYKVIVTILIALLIALNYYWAISFWKGHYIDKGYRLCLNLITETENRGYRDTDSIASCIEKYAGISVKKN